MPLFMSANGQFLALAPEYAEQATVPRLLYLRARRTEG